jgi:hypothetical protein
MPTRNETWKGKGQFTVTRDTRGRFIHWVRFVEVAVSMSFTGKAVAMYGYSVTREGRASRRYEFYGGTGRDLYHCIAYAVNHPPRGRFQSVSVRDFLFNPSKYSRGGYWIDKRVES